MSAKDKLADRGFKNYGTEILTNGSARLAEILLVRLERDTEEIRRLGCKKCLRAYREEGQRVFHENRRVYQPGARDYKYEDS